MYPESILLVILLVALGECDEESVKQDKRILDNIYLYKNVTIDTNDGCDQVIGDIDECVNCFPCEHVSVKGKLNLLEIRVRVSADVCSADSYLVLCCLPTSSSAVEIAVRENNLGMCGKLNPQNTTQEISDDGLRNTGFGHHPWVVAVLSKCFKDYYFRCAGTLINGRTVLTTARCVTSAQKNCTFKIRAGEWQFSSNDSDTETEPYKESDVDDIIVHEDFNAFMFDNNIALLILHDQIEAGKHIGFVCLDDDSAPSEDSECYVAGWGTPAGSKDRHRDIMRLVKMKHLERDECEGRLRNSTLRKHFKLDRSYRCAIGEDGLTTTKGDGGAALICALKDHRFVQYGIVALDLTFQNVDVPSLFTDVNIFKSWIDVKLDEVFKNDTTLVKDPYSI